MIHAIQQIFIGLMGLSFLVFIHETGHFLIAKWFGVRIRTFSIGFGKKLIRYKRGETTYCISAIPFGGYVAMAGENPMDESEPSEGDFSAMSVPARAGIALGGPVVNILFAFFTLFVIYLVGIREPENSRLLVGVVKDSSAASEVGILPGDTIVGIDGKQTQGWEKFNEQMGISIGDSIPLSIKRRDRLLQVIIVPREIAQLGIGYTGIHPMGWIIVPTMPAPSSPAYRAGFRMNDTILSLMGRRVDVPSDVVNLVKASGEKELKFMIKRGATVKNLIVVPKWNEELKKYMIGLSLGGTLELPGKIVKRSFVESAKKSWETGVDWVIMPFRVIHKMIRGQVKAKALSGPLGIVQLIGRTWGDGIRSLFWFLALISMNLGVINLLPLGITDGGILLFLGIEAIRKRPISRKSQMVIQQIFVALFIALALYVTTQDIFRFSLFLQ